MKKYFIATAVVIVLATSTSFAADHDIVEGKMDCTVKSNQVIGVEEGLPKTYSGIKDGIEVNDVLQFTYEFAPLGKSLYIYLKDNIRDRIIIEKRIEDDEIRDRSENQIYAGTTILSGALSFGRDFIFVENVYGNLNLQRYYKGDWEGLGTMLVGKTSVQIYTLDCRHVTDKIDEVFILLSEN
ncbi:MAG: hypothetical protein ACU0CA_14285 [Paracoccaceae bacterium]